MNEFRAGAYQDTRADPYAIAREMTLNELANYNCYITGLLAGKLSERAPIAQLSLAEKHDVDEILTVKQVARLLGLSDTAVTAYCNITPEAGGLPCERYGSGKRRPIRIKQSDLDAWRNRK